MSGFYEGPPCHRTDALRGSVTGATMTVPGGRAQQQESIGLSLVLRTTGFSHKAGAPNLLGSGPRFSFALPRSYALRVFGPDAEARI
jgi:hypothetical protein